LINKKEFKMEKAFEMKALLAKLDAAGVPVVEDMAEILVMSTLDWVQESVMMTESKLDDVAVAFIPMVKNMIKPVIDNIDGQKDM